MTSTTNPAYQHTSRTLILSVCLPSCLSETIVYSTNESSDHFHHTLLDMAWHTPRLVPKLVAKDLKLFDAAIVMDETTVSQRAASACTVHLGGQQVMIAR